MSNLIKKVFSPKLGKGYYICHLAQQPINKLPCFSREECKWFKEQNLSTSELDAVYEFRLKDWVTPLADIKYKIEPKQNEFKSLPENIQQSMKECVDSVITRVPSEAKQIDVPNITEENAKQYSDMLQGMMKGYYLIRASSGEYDRGNAKKKQKAKK